VHLNGKLKRCICCSKHAGGVSSDNPSTLLHTCARAVPQITIICITSGMDLVHFDWVWSTSDFTCNHSQSVNIRPRKYGTICCHDWVRFDLFSFCSPTRFSCVSYIHLFGHSLVGCRADCIHLLVYHGSWINMRTCCNVVRM
jgi:hypothetical protein